MTASIVPGRDLVPARDQLRELADHLAADFDVALVAVEGEDVAAQEHVAGQMAFQRLEDCVLGAGQLRGNGRVEL